MTKLYDLLSGYDKYDVRTHVLSFIRQLIDKERPDTISVSYWQHMENVLFMYSMKSTGAWELSWDLWPDKDNLDLYPVDLVLVKPEEFLDALVERNVFKSKKDAKRNGHSTAPEPGDYFFKKKTMVIRVSED